jgi:hypothetical protein
MRRAVCAVLILASSISFAEPAKRATPTRIDVLVEYQRVGHILLQLQEARGMQICAELWKQFRGLQIDKAVLTTDERTAAFDDLTDLRARIERQRGIDISGECLANPLAAGCAANLRH